MPHHQCLLIICYILWQIHLDSAAFMFYLTFVFYVFYVLYSKLHVHSVYCTN